jgi:hypothetical protein
LFLDAEADDFRWDSRVAERSLGPGEADAEEGETPLERVAVLGQMAGRWYAAIACVDTDGRLWAMHRCTEHSCREDAGRAFLAMD